MAFAIDGSNYATATSGTSLSLALSTTQANDVIVLAVGMVPAVSVSSITDTAGLTWTLRGSNENSPATQYLETYYAVAPSALSGDTITVNFNAAVTNAVVSVIAVSGANTTAPFDTNSSLPKNSTQAQAVVSTTAANTLIFGAYKSGGIAINAGSGWTQVGPAGDFFCFEYNFFTASQTNLTIPVSTTAANWEGIGDALAMAAATTDAATGSSAFGSLTGSGSAAQSDAATGAGSFGALTGSGTASANDPTSAVAAFGALAASGTGSASQDATGSGTLGALGASGSATTAGTDSATGAGQFAALGGAGSGAATDGAAGAGSLGGLSGGGSVAATDGATGAGALGALGAAGATTTSGQVAGSGAFGSLDGSGSVSANQEAAASGSLTLGASGHASGENQGQAAPSLGALSGAGTASPSDPASGSGAFGALGASGAEQPSGLVLTLSYNPRRIARLPAEPRVIRLPPEPRVARLV